MEIRLEALGEEHPYVAISYNNVGIIYGDLGDHSKALEYKEKALQILRGALGENHPDVATSYNNVGYTYGQMGNHEKALEYQEKALQIWLQVLPENHSSVATSYNNVGLIYLHLRDYENALEHLKKSLEIRLERGEDNDSDSEVNNLKQLVTILEKQVSNTQDNTDPAVSTVDSIIPDDDSAKDDSEILGEVATE